MGEFRPRKVQLQIRRALAEEEHTWVIDVDKPSNNSGVNYHNKLRASDAMADLSHVLLVYGWRHPSCAQDLTSTCFKALYNIRRWEH